MRSVKRTVAGLVVVVAIIGTVACTTASSSARSVSEALTPGEPGNLPQSTPLPAPSFNKAPRGELGRAKTGDDGAVTEADGALPDGATVFDDEYPGIANLEPHLLQGLRDATMDAAEDGVEITVNSGWRSADYQNELLHAAISEYGSEKEAARWVATADTSPHVSGHAVDIGSVDGTTWLSEHGAVYALCQIYRNEPWHFELRPHPIDRGCPGMYADPTRDPRMQR
jgi:D-alanyl-D-alanine carboxypeptidase